MKKYLNFALVLFAGLTVALSCSKIEKEIDNPVVEPGNEVVSIPVTVTAILPDVDTKVTFEAQYDPNFKPTDVSRKWESTDLLRVYNHANLGEYVDLTLDSGDGTDTAVFSGDITFTATSYDVAVVSGGETDVADYTSQNQAGDGDTAHLKFVASATGVTDLTADINLSETSGVLAIIAQMPKTASAPSPTSEIESVEIESIGANVFGTGNKITVNLGSGDLDADDVLKVYANVPAGWTLPADTELFIRFNAPSSSTHTVYTRYYKVKADTDLGNGKFSYLKLNCSHIDQYAGGSDKGTSAAPYLIADKYQMDAIHNLLVGDQTLRYFKLVDDIDMTGIVWVPLNNVADASSKFSQYIYFDGNNHTISNLSTATTPAAYPSIFGVLNGTVKDLTIDHATITPGTSASGGKSAVLAGYLGSSDSTVIPSVNNITITNSTVGTSSSKGGNYCAILAAQIGKAETTVSNITITGCSVYCTNYAGGLIGDIKAKSTISGTNMVTNTNVYGSLAGGFIGYAEAITTMSGCAFIGGTASATGRYAGGMVASIGNYTSTFSACYVKDATVSGDNRIGGFVGQQQKSATISNCYVSGGSVKGTTINVGAFAGVGYGPIENSYADGTTVTSDNEASDTKVGLGGFVGYLSGSLTKCHASVSIDQKGSYIGGLVGYMLPGGSISKCYSTGNVTSNYRQIGGLVGGLGTKGKFTIEDSYATGDVKANSYVGGLIGEIVSDIETVTVSRCYSSGNVTTTSFGAGGLIGFVSSAAITIQDCAAWNSSVTASSIGSENWSTGSVVGVAFPICTLTDNYRNPSIKVKAYWGNQTGYTYLLEDDYQHPNVEGATHPLVVRLISDGSFVETTAVSIASGQHNRPQYAYHGKVEAGKTLSQLAATTLGWDTTTVWDCTKGDLPVLR